MRKNQYLVDNFLSVAEIIKLDKDVLIKVITMGNHNLESNFYVGHEIDTTWDAFRGLIFFSFSPTDKEKFYIQMTGKLPPHIEKSAKQFYEFNDADRVDVEEWGC